MRSLTLLLTTALLACSSDASDSPGSAGPDGGAAARGRLATFADFYAALPAGAGGGSVGIGEDSIAWLAGTYRGRIESPESGLLSSTCSVTIAPNGDMHVEENDRNPIDATPTTLRGTRDGATFTLEASSPEPVSVTGSYGRAGKVSVPAFTCALLYRSEAPIDLSNAASLPAEAVTAPPAGLGGSFDGYASTDTKLTSCVVKTSSDGSMSVTNDGASVASTPAGGPMTLAGGRSSGSLDLSLDYGKPTLVRIQGVRTVGATSPVAALVYGDPNDNAATFTCHLLP